jgi:hypothetical protein
MFLEQGIRHGRTCPGHPGKAGKAGKAGKVPSLSEIAGTSPAMMKVVI